MRRRAGSLVVIIAALLASSGIAASAPAAAVTEGVELLFAAENTGVSRPGEALTVSGSVTNLSDSAIPAGTINIAIDPDVAGSDELAEAYESPAEIEGAVVGAITTPPLPVAGSAQLSVTIPAAVLDGALAGTGWGAHALVASLNADDAVVASNASAVVRLDGPAPASLEVAVVLPVTTPPTTEALIPASALEEYTGANGLLTRRLDAATDPAITLAIDPRILASIRVLGTSAPESATLWLERLESLSNETFPLQYGDGDLTLERVMGSPAPLLPTSFLWALNPDDFPADAAPETSAPTFGVETPSPTPTATPSDEAAPPSVPTIDELLAFDYTATDIAWPGAARVSSDDLAFVSQAGLERTIVSADQIADAVPGPVGATDERTVLVSDSASDAVSTAAFALGSSDSRFAASRAAAELAGIVTAEPGTPQRRFLTLARGQSTPSNVADALSPMLSLPWLSLAPLSEIASAESVDVTLEPQADERAAAFSPLLADEASIGQFATVLDQPELLTGPARLSLLGAVSAGWASDQEAWAESVATLRESTSTILKSVSVDSSSQINIASFTADTPLYVTNALPYPVNVSVLPRASNGRILIEGADATIEAASTQRVLLQAKAVVNGRVTLAVSLSSPTGVPLGDPQYIQIDVQPFWETAGIAVMGALVLALLGFGTFRSIRRRRRGEPAVVKSDTTEQ